MESVQVAVRIRPLLDNEINLGCQKCVERITNEPQLRVGKANNFYTFNYVFDEFEGQNKVYDEAVKGLMDKLFKGYNLTILAYGQTGSGKTFTMGTNYSGNGEMGVIPRAVYEIFDTMKTMDNHKFHVTVSFLELYNESLYDLLANKSKECSVVDLREINNEICIPGLTEIEVHDPSDTLNKLQEGSLGRATGATAMNAQSSRSHAIFTINIRIVPDNNPDGAMTSSFRLVDLAGSERSKKTGTTGDRFKEGVNINKGLLVLGNVISQLGEGSNNYVSYRNSKLTRLLQDSLGGNSVTLMIACVSPADYNQDETLSTLRYADRVKKIKNKPVVNQDPQSAEIRRLKKENEELRLKIIHNAGCPPSHQSLQDELNEARLKLNLFNKELTEALWNNTKMYETAAMAEQFDAKIKEKLEELVQLADKANGSDHVLINEFAEKIKQLQMEYVRAGRELLKHEVNSVRESNLDTEHSPTKQEFILSQAKINKEITTLTQNLLWKEELMATYYENSNNIADIQNASEMMEDLKKQIADLQLEKDELLKQLSSSSASSKIAETRRKRLQELEAKVAALMKKVAEQERMIKMKATSDDKIKTLKNDIAEMKKMKVRLIQQMKAGSEKFQAWKVAQNKELVALKNQNIRKQNEIKKLEQIYNREQNVLKRKLEVAAAANKRLVAALEKQKSARASRLKGSAINLIKEKINEELEILESTCQARKSLENLMGERAQLAQDYANIKARIDNPQISEEERNKLLNDKKLFKEELALRNTEIADLQQKLLDVHEDLTPNGWDVLQSMGDAKNAVNYLYSLLNEKIKDNISKEHHITDIWEQFNEARKEIDLLKRQLDNLSNNFIKRRKDHDVSKSKSKKSGQNQFEVADEETLKAFDDSLEIDCDNVENDPDWTKTPLFKKIQTLKAKRSQQNNTKCDCSGICEGKCSCKKLRKTCSDHCNCDRQRCGGQLKNSSNSCVDEVDSNSYKRSSESFPDLLGDVHPKKKKMYFENP